VCSILKGLRSVVICGSIVDVVGLSIQIGSYIPQVSVIIPNVSTFVASLRGRRDSSDIPVPIGVHRVTSISQGISRVRDPVTLECSGVASVVF